MRLSRGAVMLASMCGIAACSTDPVEWGDVHYSPAGAAAMPATVPVEGASELTSVPLPDPSACRSSVRIARAAKSFYAVWWSVRRDSSSSLLFSRSDDGGPWSKPVVADSSDASVRGCARPSPSVATDLASGYVHLAYYIEPAAGAGVFFAHTMDRGGSFHAPVPLVFGARPTTTSVSAEGDRVAVAYEEPNGARPLIFVALSKTMGHLFELKLPVTDESSGGFDPTVKLRGTKLEVTWTEGNPPDSTRERHASRTGAWK